jgi:hypothetical protein
MAFRRRNTRRRRYIRRRNTNSTVRIARREARKAINRNIETKYVDGNVSGAITAISATGSLFSLHGTYTSGSFVAMTQGVNTGEYIGQWIKPTWIKIKWALEAADSSNLITIMVVQAKGLWVNSGDMSNILETVNTTSAPLQSVDSAYSSRFKVLYRRMIKVDTDDPLMSGSIKIGPRKLRKLHFTDAFGSSESGHIMIGFISDSTAISHPTLRMVHRFYFKDA